MAEKDNPIFSIFNLLRYANGLNRERVKFYGLNDLETITLINIGSMENPSQKEICQRLKSPKQTINNIIKDLEDKGFVELMPSSYDKRVRVLRLTKMGIENRDKNLQALIDANMRMYQSLGDEKVKQIEEALKLFICAIKENFMEEE